MQLRVRKHNIQFTLKYVLLKYIISVISSLFILKCSSFSQGKAKPNQTTIIIESFKNCACITLSHSPVWHVVQTERTVGIDLNVFFS